MHTKKPVAYLMLLSVCLSASRPTFGQAPGEGQKGKGDIEASRQRAAESLFQKAVAAAGSPSADASQVLSAISAALAAGASPTKVLTEGAFAKIRTEARFRELIATHTRQSSIDMRLSGEPGAMLDVSGVVLGENGEPVKWALVFVFQTDAKGLYSAGGMDEANPRLFGYMRTDEHGRFAFKTIRPGHYPDQNEPVEQHIHGEVTAAGFEKKVIRIGFTDDPFWKKQGKAPPRWAVPVTRGADGTDACTVEVRLEKEKGRP